MKRVLCIVFILLVLAACSRKGPTPTSPPEPTLTASPTPLPSSTPTPQGPQMGRITVVPSATRLFPARQEGTKESDPLPTLTVVLPPSPVPSATRTPQVIDAGATATQPPTATLPESPLATPTPAESPLVPPPGAIPTPPEATSNPSGSTPSPTPGEAVPTAAPTLSADGSPTSTPPHSPTPGGEAWQFNNVLAYYDDEYHELHLSGEVVNRSGRQQRITTLLPVVYDREGNQVTLDESVSPVLDYEKLMETISLAPDQSLAFGFIVHLPNDLPYEERYEIEIEAEPDERTRDDLEGTLSAEDTSEWPYLYHVEGRFENPGPDLTEYVVVLVTAYDEDAHVIGLGWFYETDPIFLAAGAHDFGIEVEISEIVKFLELKLSNRVVQVFGY